MNRQGHDETALTLEVLVRDELARPLINGVEATEMQMQEMIRFSRTLAHGVMSGKKEISEKDIYKAILASVKWSCHRFTKQGQPFIS